MDFKISKLKYAYTLKGIVNITNANKDEEYFLDEKLTIPLIFCSGDKNINHWRKKSNISENDLKMVFGNSESIEHYNKKMEIAENLYIDCNILGLRYKATSSKTEYYIKSINKIVDVAFFDFSGNLLVCVEVYYTNKKTKKDIDKFNLLDIIVYEYDIQKRRCYPISAGTPEKEISRRILLGGAHIQRVSVGQQRDLRRNKYLKKGFKRIDEKIRKKWRCYYEFKEEIESRYSEYERRIKRFKERQEEKCNRECSKVYDAFRERITGNETNIKREEETMFEYEKQIEESENIERQYRRIREIRKEIIRIENEIKE